MGLIQTLKDKFMPNYEVDCQRFYTEFLNLEDAENLGSFILNFSNRITEKSAILAVGTSVYPKSHWSWVKKMNSRYSDFKASESYNDIDLLVVPHKIVPLNEVESAVQDALSQMNYEFALHEVTSLGPIYSKNSSYLEVDYGLHSIETHLKNGTKLDLILGREDLLLITAYQKILEERKEKRPFSILYW